MTGLEGRPANGWGSESSDPGPALHYGCELSRFPTTLAGRFMPFGPDDACRAYLERVRRTRAGRLKTWCHRALVNGLSHFDVNALLGMYPMHLLGTEQWARLVGSDPTRRHLDVGSGSGDVTRALAPLSKEVATTEVSRGMARALTRQGFRCFRTDVAEAGVPEPPYGLITCLNVLDRCARPRTLLERLRDALTPAGTLAIATPLPFDPFVYHGPVTDHTAERLSIPGASFEESALAFIERCLAPIGLEVTAFTRAPYFSGGDAYRPFYVLDDVVVVCERLGAS